MKIKYMQKSSRKTTRFPLNFHAIPMDKGLHEREAEKSVKWELAKRDYLTSYLLHQISCFTHLFPLAF